MQKLKDGCDVFFECLTNDYDNNSDNKNNNKRTSF